MLDAFGISDRGRVRQNNEDSYLIDREFGLYIVADGMGGAQAGERASRMAVDTVSGYLHRIECVGDGSLTRAFEEANKAVIETASGSADLKGMGTTLVAALDCGAYVEVASVGDSRAYLFSAGFLDAITEDQTWVQEVGRRLGIDESSLRTHPMRHVFTMAIGVTEELRIHSYRVLLGPGDQILLCSDGLHGVVEANDIAHILASGFTPEERCRMLVDAALERGGPDNVTVVVVQAS